MEAEAVFTVQQVAATAFLLYMCKLHPVLVYPKSSCLTPRQLPLPSIWSARSSKPLPTAEACHQSTISA